MKASAVIWIALALLLMAGLTFTSALHTREAIRRDVETCARSAGWLSDADCKVMCSGRVK